KKATPYGGLWVVGMTGLPSVNLGGGVQYQSPVRFAHGVFFPVFRLCTSATRQTKKSHTLRWALGCRDDRI
ncbi:MAG: hypothetical protein KGZ82_12805, partial [Bacteroidales bacterium]|nr:hypothetical protein [Bacteroidales bacterium]